MGPGNARDPGAPPELSAAADPARNQPLAPLSARSVLAAISGLVISMFLASLDQAIARQVAS